MFQFGEDSIGKQPFPCVWLNHKLIGLPKEAGDDDIIHTDLNGPR